MTRTCLALLCLALMSAHPARAAEPPAAERAFTALGALVGDWEATTAKGSVIRINYRLVSADSVLVQTFTTASGRQTLTLFHLDGATLLATHYCAQGNQPRLRLDGPGTGPTFMFTFRDATNLPDAGASHLTRLALELTDATHYTESETYTAHGKDDTTILKFTRVK